MAGTHKKPQNYRTRATTRGSENMPTNIVQSRELDFAPDTIFAFVVFVILSTGFWQLIGLKLNFLALSDVNILKLLVQSAFCALCFVPIAVYWERVRFLFTPLFPVLFALLMVMASAFWSAEPANSIRDSVVLLVMFAAALGGVLHFKSYKLIAILTLSVVISLILQFLAQIIDGDIGGFAFKNSEISLCFALSLMASSYKRPSRILWLMIAGLVFVIGIITNERQVYLVAIMCAIITIMHRLSLSIKDRTFFFVSQFVNIIALVTLLILFYGSKSLEQMWFILSQMDANSLFGTGFLGDGQNILFSFVNGLGLMGFMLGLLFMAYIIGGLLVKPNMGLGIKIFEFSLIAIILSNSGGITTFSLPLLALFIAMCLNIMPSAPARSI